MKLQDHHLEELLTVSIKAALKAGKIIKNSQNKFITINKKDTGNSLATSVVTEVDLKSQEAIIENLNDSIKKYNLGLLAEESKDNFSRFEKDYFWSIDPLDGTLPFTEGRDGYSVSIALVTKEGIPVIGTIFDPETESLYHAIKGKGVFKNGNPLKIEINYSKKLSVYIHRSFLKKPQYRQYMEQVKKLAESNGIDEIKISSHGGVAMNACWLLENYPSLYFVVPKKEEGGGCLWDYAAASLIVKEAGAYAEDFFGNPIELNKESTTFLNQNGILMTTNLAFVIKV